LELSGGKLDHETILNLNYLEAAINENLRLYGPATDNFRLCSKDIEINGIKFRKGTRVLMPVYPVHHSEEYFPEPEKFLPERFLKENSGSITPFTFRAFGGGSRQCIGQRFAMNEMKACMAKLLAKFRLEMAPETKLEFEKGSFFLLIFKDIKIKFVARE
jgi:cytochrome P450